MDLAVTYLKKRFENPFVLASGPPTANADMIARAFEAGWAGAVIKTLILEPVRNLHNRFASLRAGPEIIGFENIELLSERSPDAWFRDIRRLKSGFPGKQVIGSIMGDALHPGPWLELALGCQDAGCDLVELNFSCPHGCPEKGGGAVIGQNADYAGTIMAWLRNERRLTVPLIPKLTAATADIAGIGRAVAAAGADGLCAINTFPSIMGVDLQTLLPRPAVAGRTAAGGYSGPGLKPIALRCVSDLVKQPGLPVMACGGVSSGMDAAEFILLGAPIVQVCTAVMLNGYALLERMKTELREFMGAHGFAAPGDFLGRANRCVGAFSELDPAYRVTGVVDEAKCNGCGLCAVSCRDAASQAIAMAGRLARIDAGKCCGCSLCAQVCPPQAIKMVRADRPPAGVRQSPP